MRLRDEGVTWRELDGEMVILDLESSTYLTTNRTGTALLRQLVEDRSLDDLVQELVTTFDVSADQAEHDARSFITELDEAGLLAPASPASEHSTTST